LNIVWLILEKKKINFDLDTKTMKNENQQKYFHKKRPMSQNIKQIYLTLRNFLWFPHLRSQLTNIRYPHIHILYLYFMPAKYFGRSLQQWNQQSKWQNFRTLVKPLLRSNSYRNWKGNTFKNHFFKKAYNTFSHNNPLLTKKPWSSWVKKKKKNISTE